MLTYSNDLILDLLSILSLVFGVAVVVSKNPIVSILFLIGLIFNISCYLIILGLSFIGLSYLLVYVGAISILFLFILMLINIRVSELITDNNNSIPLSLIIISIFGITFQGQNSTPLHLFNTIYYGANNNIFYASSSPWDNVLSQISQISNIGSILYTNNPMLLLITSLILLLAMVGSIIITINNK